MGWRRPKQTHDAPAREHDETDEVFWDESGIPWVMALKRKVDDAGDEDDKEQGEPTCEEEQGARKRKTEGCSSQRSLLALWRASSSA